MRVNLLRVAWATMFFFLAASAASAAIPPLNMVVDDGLGVTAWNAVGTGVDNGDGTFTYNGGRSSAGGDDRWAMTWDVTVDPDPFILSNTTITNSTGTTNTYVITLSAPIIPLINGSLTGGSVAGSFTTPSLTGGALTTNGSNPLYMSIIDGVDYVPLYSGPLSFSRTSPGSVGIPDASFGDPIPSLPGPPILSSIGIRLEFVLAPGDQASFTSLFMVVPEPSSIALAGTGVLFVVGLIFKRRKR